MKKIILAAASLAASLSFAQVLSTPGGTVGSSTNDNVGIGTTSPQGSLDINANGSIPIIRGNGGYIPSGLRFIDDSYTQPGQTKEWAIWKGNEWAKGLAFMRYDAVNPCAGGICDTPLFLHDNGNVGIGTNDPQTKLDINGTLKSNNHTIAEYSPTLFLDRNTTVGGFTQGIQSRMQDGTNNWFFGNLAEDYWVVSKGDHQNAKMSINSLGNVGIGILNSQSKLTVFDNGAAGTNQFELRTSHLRNTDRYFMKNVVAGSGSDDVTFSLRHDGQMFVDGDVGIGITNPQAKLDVNGTVRFQNLSAASTPNTTYLTLDSNGNVQTQSGTPGGNSAWYSVATGTSTNANTDDMFVMGKVGIGSQHPDEKLTVKGKIHAEELRVDLQVPADYVFEKYYTGKSDLKADYNMPTLSQVEKYTKENNHLPNIPSAKEIKEKGLQIGEMTNLLLQKIEELTLYTIEQQKRIEALEKQINVSK